MLLSRDMTAKLADVALARAMRHTHHTLTDNTPGTFDYVRWQSWQLGLALHVCSCSAPPAQAQGQLLCIVY